MRAPLRMAGWSSCEHDLRDREVGPASAGPHGHRLDAHRTRANMQAVEHQLPLIEPNVALDRVAPVERDPDVADVGVQREEVAVPRRTVVPARRERHPFDPVGRAEVRLDPFAVAGSARALVPGGAEVVVERLLGAVRMDGVADEARRTHGLGA